MLSATVAATVFAGLAGGCGDDDSPPAAPVDDAGPDTSVITPPEDSGSDVVTPPPLGATAKRASKSGTIAISDDDAIVGMVNPEDGSVSFFQTSDNARLSVVKTGTGAAPSAIVIASDSKTAWVANRGTATVVKITGIDTATPAVGAPINVGSEPTGIALSPRGSKLFVAELAEGSVSVIDTAAGTRTAIAGAVRNPRAIAVTNDLDDDEADETVVVTEFFGEPVAGKETANDGRIGRVRLFGVDGSDKGKIDFQPFTNDTAPLDGATFEEKTQPNQLHAVAINGTQVFVPSISSSPALPLRFDQNLYAVMHVGDLATKAEVTGANGTANLTQAVQKKTIAGNKFFLADVVDVDFVPGLKVAYAVSRGADVVQRIDYSGAELSIGATQAAQIDVQGNPSASDVKACHNPTGIAIGEKLQKGYVNCWGSHRMAILDFTSQSVADVKESTAPATTAIDRGRHFFFTGRGRWSGNGTAAAEPTANGQAWSSCGSCHPDGLSDNVTWTFAAGPRQSTSLDGSFTHGATGAGRQRFFNWTGIIDEMHDFEANTRGTSGGKGAITNAPTGSCGQLGQEVRRVNAGVLPGGLQLSNKDLADGVIGDTPAGQERCGRTDWDDINEYVKSIVPAQGKKFLDAGAVQRGADLFKGDTGGCSKCHGGGGWTISRRPYNPSNGGTATFGALAFPAPGVTPAAGIGPFLTKNTTQISTQTPPAGAAAPDDTARAPGQGSCVIRDVGTFGVRQAGGALDVTVTEALERRGGADPRAQGFTGYNVPSLYGVTLGAPYLHHGQAATLTALFTDDRFKAHWTAGNPNFDPASGTNRADLIAFVESIDATTAEATVAAGFDVCPAN
ncbi:MAG: YncE family protein [Labilithrix sp.]|nr:YncE family protein [Labilithrix sp.]MCW5810875.1 YncE family protein [Labilithrix sp.]